MRLTTSSRRCAISEVWAPSPFSHCPLSYCRFLFTLSPFALRTSLFAVCSSLLFALQIRNPNSEIRNFLLDYFLAPGIKSARLAAFVLRAAPVTSKALVTALTIHDSPLNCLRRTSSPLARNPEGFRGFHISHKPESERASRAPGGEFVCPFRIGLNLAPHQTADLS
jgi:hypothetical protein